MLLHPTLEKLHALRLSGFARGLQEQMETTDIDSLGFEQRLGLLVGATGTGKSYLASALARRACLQGYSALYLRVPRLFGELALARGDGRYGRLLRSLAKVDLLVLDDWGLSRLDELERQDLLEIMEDRYQLRSTIVASQLPVEAWHEVIANPTLADAVLDRLVNNAYRISLTGGSMRRKLSGLTQSNELEA